MRFARYELNGTIGYGIVSGDSLSVLSGCPFGEYSEAGETVALADVKLLAPTTPTKVLAVGLNYRSHLGGAPEPQNPEIFIKTPSCINDPGGNIELPDGDDEVHAEGELVVIMKEQTRKGDTRRGSRQHFGRDVRQRCQCTHMAKQRLAVVARQSIGYLWSHRSRHRH